MSNNLYQTIIYETYNLTEFGDKLSEFKKNISKSGSLFVITNNIYGHSCFNFKYKIFDVTLAKNSNPVIYSAQYVKYFLDNHIDSRYHNLNLFYCLHTLGNKNLLNKIFENNYFKENILTSNYSDDAFKYLSAKLYYENFSQSDFKKWKKGVKNLSKFKNSLTHLDYLDIFENNISTISYNSNLTDFFLNIQEYDLAYDYFTNNKAKNINDFKNILFHLNTFSEIRSDSIEYLYELYDFENLKEFRNNDMAFDFINLFLKLKKMNWSMRITLT